MRELIKLTILDTEQCPAGSKKMITTRLKTGAMKTIVIEDNDSTRTWKKIVKGIGLAMWGCRDLVTSPLFVHALFQRKRPAGHYGTGRNENKVNKSARRFPTVMPDVLKLMRGTEDALTGVIWKDDAQICDEFIRKRYGPTWKTEILIAELEEEDL